MYYKEFNPKNTNTVIVIHGGNGAWWNGIRLFPYLENFHILAVDLPGHGYSPGEFTMDECIHQLHELIAQKAHHNKAILLGHSLGAKIADEFAYRYPDKTLGVISLSACFSDSLSTRILSSTLISNIFMPKNPIDAQQAKEVAIKTGFKDPEMIQYACDPKYYCFNRKLYKTYAKILREYSKVRDYSNYFAPMLICVGTKEIKAMIDSSLKLANAVKQSEFVYIENQPHSYPITDVKQTGRVIKQWLDKHYKEDETQ